MRWIYRHPRIYDLADHLVSLSFATRVRRKILSRLTPASFLEIGVGSGKSLRLVHSELLIGIDTSTRMLEFATSKYPEARFLLADAHRLPLKDACVDVSAFAYCLRGLARPVEAVKEALRVSSMVIVIDYNKPSFIPCFLWKHVIEKLGYAVFGSRDLDYEAIGRLADSRTMSFYNHLYTVIVLDGAGHARD